MVEERKWCCTFPASIVTHIKGMRSRPWRPVVSRPYFFVFRINAQSRTGYLLWRYFSELTRRYFLGEYKGMVPSTVSSEQPVPSQVGAGHVVCSGEVRLSSLGSRPRRR